MRSIQSKTNSAIKQLVERIITSGQITRSEHLNLASVLLAAQKITDEDRSQINRVFDYIQTGRLKLVD